MKTGIPRVAAFVAVLLLAGCMTSRPAPTEHYYRLSPAYAYSPTKLPVPISFHVQRFTADGLIRERALLYSDDGGHRVLKQHNYHFWADAPARLLQDYWTTQLWGSNPEHGGQSDVKQYMLHGRVRRMERLLHEDRVEIALSIELRVLENTRGNDVIERLYEVIERAVSDRVVDSVKAYEIALQAILTQFVADLSTATSLAGNSSNLVGTQLRPVLTALPAYERIPETD